MHACMYHKQQMLLRMQYIDIGADVALSAVINIQSLKLHLNFGSLFKCMTFVPDIPL